MKNQRKSRKNKGFTLIELLVVITIIAILAGLSFAGVNLAIKKTKKTEGLVMATAIKSAVENFYDEYNRLPDVSQEVETDAGGGQLLSILLGLEGTGDDIENTRNIIFLQGKEAKGKRGGIVYGATGETVDGIFDPFGNPYTVVLNVNYDDTLSFSFGNEQVRLRGRQVAVYSKGGDGEFNTTDDIKSW